MQVEINTAPRHKGEIIEDHADRFVINVPELASMMLYFNRDAGSPACDMSKEISAQILQVFNDDDLHESLAGNWTFDVAVLMLDCLPTPSAHLAEDEKIKHAAAAFIDALAQRPDLNTLPLPAATTSPSA